MTSKLSLIIATAAMTAFAAVGAKADTLRLLTWGGYAPDGVVAAFEKATGIHVQVTLSNNEDMISKLRATGGAGFDLAQPSDDRITGPQEEYGIYKPLNLSKINAKLFNPTLLAAAEKNTTVKGKIYGVAAVWGTSGFAVNSDVVKNLTDYHALCSAQYAGKISMRLKRIPLIGMAFADGHDPFAAYSDVKKYTKIITQAAHELAACKKNVKAYWSGADDLMAMMRSGEVVASEAWDATAFKLNTENPKFKFVAPSTGAMGWIDTFALPAKGENDAAAYKWINFVMQPKIAAQIADAAGSFSASEGSAAYVNPHLKAAFNEFYTPAVIKNIKWFPPIPAGLEDIEGKLLDQIAAQ